MDMGLLIPLSPFIMVVLIVWFSASARAKSNAAIQKTVQKAIEKGVELTPETIKSLGVRTRSPHSDLRTGVINIAVALGLIVMGYGLSMGDVDEEVFPVLASIAAIPGFIGLALIVMYLVTKNNKSD